METTTEVTGGKRLLAATEIPNPSDFQSRRKFVAAVATLSLAACGGGSKSDPGVADPVPMGPISPPTGDQNANCACMGGGAALSDRWNARNTSADRNAGGARSGQLLNANFRVSRPRLGCRYSKYVTTGAVNGRWAIGARMDIWQRF